MPAIHRFVDAGFVAVCSLYGAEDGLVLHEATPVRLRLSRQLSAADATVGETVAFDVVDEVKIGDALLIPQCDAGIATVTKAVSKKRKARSNKPNVNIDYVRLVNGDKMALRAVKKTNGAGDTEVMKGRVVATAIVFFPAPTFFRFMHGKEITIPKGTEITAYTSGEIKLDPAKFITISNASQKVQVVPAGPKLTDDDMVCSGQ
jgi:hypothetical protein